MEVRNDWTKEELQAIHDTPILDLIYRAAQVHRHYHVPRQIQVCNLINIKVGGCPEDCKYCPQAARYHTDVKASPMMKNEEILQLAQQAKKNGATRVCIGASWRSVRDSPQFEEILEAVKQITAMGLEVCCTLGMLNEDQAKRLKKAGLYAYNHNLDSSPEFYKTIISTRTYEDRLNTLDTVAQTGISVCCGGIIGMGETIEDRIGLLYVLARRNPHPESVPINILMPVKGTPLGDSPPVPIWDMVRMIATARIAMPKAMVRFTAGRIGRSFEEQALCFLAGANSIFSGERLLTRPNPDFDEDRALFKLLNLQPRPAFA